MARLLQPAATQARSWSSGIFMARARAASAGPRMAIPGRPTAGGRPPGFVASGPPAPARSALLDVPTPQLRLAHGATGPGATTADLDAGLDQPVPDDVAIA